MKRKLVVAALCASCLLLNACGQPKEIASEPYEAVPYTLYPAPEDAYVGDTMPFVTEDGNLELYYLYDTDHNGQAYHPVWKYVTEDFTGYDDHGQVLEFGLMSDPDPAIGTGSVIQDKDGKYHMYYTGHNDAGNGGHGKECVMHAVSDDSETWTKVPEDTFFAPENYSKDDFRDPEVFWCEEENCYWMLMAGRDNRLGGVTAKYTSDDLKKWEFCGEIFAPNDQYMLECPSILKINDTYYLTYSWDCVTYYAVSDSINGPYTVPEDNVLDGTGFIFYAAKTEHFKDNDYLCGWIGRAGTLGDSGMYQWAGNVLNHQLVELEKGVLGVKAPDTFYDYFTQDKEFKAVPKEGKVKIKDTTVTISPEADSYAIADMGTRPAEMMLECDVTIGEDGVAGFCFGKEDDPEPTALGLDRLWNMIHYEGTIVQDIMNESPIAYTQFDFSKGEKHHIKMICENEIVVVYVDDTKALSSRINNSIDGARFGLYSAGAESVFENVTMKLPE
ncbi:MAG: family 43 glycosylhydrolase [Lachnospiraceae bacterium]|nr:family 43 glycosylhydrolase [Lachnospiraceae bacterium]